MCHDDLGIFKIHAKELCGTLGYKAVACSVETVSSDLVFLIILMRQTVKICLLRHCLMKSGIEYANHRHVRHQFLAGIDTDQVCRVVKRCKIVALFDSL